MYLSKEEIQHFQPSYIQPLVIPKETKSTVVKKITR